MNPLRLVAPLTVAVALAACGQSPSGAAKATGSAVAMTAPAGQYQVDPNHTSLVGKVQHMNLAPYNLRFTRYDVKVNLDPANLAASSVEVTIDPTSVRTDYTGDYKGTHKDSPVGSPGTELEFAL